MPSFLALLWLVAPSFALDVERRTDGEAVVVSAQLPHGVDAVRALLSQDEVTMRLGKDIRDVEVTPLESGCVQLTVSNRGFGKDLRYIAERCETPDGWHSKLLSSEDFLKHDIRWSMRAKGEATEVSIRVVVQLKSIVPRWLIDRFVGGALEATLNTMNAMLNEPHLAE